MVFRTAGNIYAAYVAAGRVDEWEEEKWLARSLQEAVRLAQLTELAVESDSELD